jgi:hypothetical protein
MPGWDALTFVGTVVLIVYAALAYHRSPQANDSMAAMATTATARPRAIRSIPKRTIIASALASILFLITLGLMMMRPTMQGPQGPAGAQGPPGEVGSADPRIAELLERTATLEAKIIPLERLMQLQGCLEQLDAFASKEQMDNKVLQIQTEITSQPRMHGLVSQWPQFMGNITTIANGCYPNEPAQFQYNAPQAPLAAEKIDELRQRLKGEIANLKQHISHLAR